MKIETKYFQIFEFKSQSSEDRPDATCFRPDVNPHAGFLPQLSSGCSSSVWTLWLSRVCSAGLAVRMLLSRQDAYVVSGLPCKLDRPDALSYRPDALVFSGSFLIFEA